MTAFDRIIGLHLAEVAVDWSLHKVRCGNEGTGKTPIGRGKIGWKWSVAAEQHGVLVDWAVAGANRLGVTLLEPTLAAVADTSLVIDVETLRLDRGYADDPVVQACACYDIIRPPKRWPGTAGGQPKTDPLGQRWIVEPASSWLPNYG